MAAADDGVICAQQAGTGNDEVVRIGIADRQRQHTVDLREHAGAACSRKDVQHTAVTD